MEGVQEWIQTPENSQENGNSSAGSDRKKGIFHTKITHDFPAVYPVGFQLEEAGSQTIYPSLSTRRKTSCHQPAEPPWEETSENLAV